MKTLPRLFAAFAVTASMTAAVPTPSAGEAPAFDPVAAYGSEIVFDVYRKNAPIGHHTVRFSRNGDTLTAESHFRIRISVLGLPLYTYEYTSTDRWRDGTLQELYARTDDDGVVSEVVAQRHGGELKVIADTEQTILDGDVFPTTHWNPAVIGTSRLLNTITGQVNAVDMTLIAMDDVDAGAERRRARHFAYTGELETEVWYDAGGRWVKMRFDGKDGVPIEYRCVRCGNPLPLSTGTDAGVTEDTL